MNLDIRSVHLALESDAIDRIRERFEHSLDHFDRHILGGHIVLSDVNGPKGGADKHCMVRLHVRGSQEIVIEEEGVDLFSVAGRAAERLAVAVGHSVDKKRHGHVDRKPGIDRADRLP